MKAYRFSPSRQAKLLVLPTISGASQTAITHGHPPNLKPLAPREACPQTMHANYRSISLTMTHTVGTPWHLKFLCFSRYVYQHRSLLNAYCVEDPRALFQALDTCNLI